MTRLRRHQTDPVLDGKPFRPRNRLALGDGDLVVQYHCSRWNPVAENEEGVRRRVTRAKLLSNGDHAGSLELVEYEIPWLMGADEFLYEMDAYSMATCHLAEVLCAHWEEPADLGEYGSVLELNRAWMRPAYSSNGNLKAAVDGLLEKLFDDRSLLILKAFPLEYEGEVTDFNRNHFRRRQAAMMRHYRHLFGVDALPGSNGEAGWMYAMPERLEGIIAAPKV